MVPGPVVRNAQCLLELIKCYGARVYQNGPDADPIVDMIRADDISAAEDKLALPLVPLHEKNARLPRCVDQLDNVYYGQMF
jgi:hypothetical protein